MNRVAFSIGPISICWYSIMVVIGIILAITMVLREAKRLKMNQEFFINLIFYVILFGIIGARIYYVLFNISDYIIDPLEIFKVWHGGLAIHGGIIAGIITVIVYCKKYKVNILKTLDIFCVGVILGQIAGRWGNFFNQEAFGQITTKAALQKFMIPNFIIEGMYIDGAYRQPTFLYESLWNIIGFIILIIIRRRQQAKKGQMIGFYMIWYSIGRFVIESFRTDSLMLGSIRVAQLVSIILFIIGTILIIRSKMGSKFKNLYNGEKDETKF